MESFYAYPCISFSSIVNIDLYFNLNCVILYQMIHTANVTYAYPSCYYMKEQRFYSLTFVWHWKLKFTKKEVKDRCNCLLLDGSCILVRVSIAVEKNTITITALEGKCLSQLKALCLYPIAEGCQDGNSNRAKPEGRNWYAGYDRVLLTGMLSIASTACFLIPLGTTSPGMTLPTISLAFPQQ